MTACKPNTPIIKIINDIESNPSSRLLEDKFIALIRSNYKKCNKFHLAEINKLKNEIYDKTTPGNTSTKTSNAATKLMEWDREHKFKKTEASWSANNKQFYLNIFKTSFGGSKKRTTRKKRKNRKTNRRKK